jgi:hypothetical protein
MQSFAAGYGTTVKGQLECETERKEKEQTVNEIDARSFEQSKRETQW